MGGTGGGSDGNEEHSFEARLRAARERQGLDPRSDQPGASRVGGLPTSALGIGLRVAIELVSALALAVAIGWGLDHWLHTAPIFMAVFVLLGGAAGVLNVWRVMGPGTSTRGRGG